MTRSPEDQMKMLDGIAKLQMRITQAIKKSIPDVTEQQAKNASLSVLLSMTEDDAGLVFALNTEVQSD